MSYKAIVTSQAKGGISENYTYFNVIYIDTTTNYIVDVNGVQLFFGTDITAFTLAEIIAAVKAGILTESTAQGYGLTAADIIWGIPSARIFSAASRSLNTAFQISTSSDVSVNYSVDIAATLSLTTGQVGTIILEYADNSGMSTNVIEVGRYVNGNAGSLAIGLNLTQTSTANIGGMIPAGKYVRIRTINTTGTPTFTYRSGQEILL